MGHKILLCGYCLLFCLCSVMLFGQDEIPTKITVQNRGGELPFSTTIGTGVEEVGATSQNLHITIPILHVPGRGMDYEFNLNYDARFWVAATRTAGSSTFEVWNIDAGGVWSTNAPYVTNTADSTYCNSFDVFFNGPTGTLTERQNYIYHDASGAKHPLGIDYHAASCNEGSYVIYNSREPDLSASGMIATYTPPQTAVNAISLPDGTVVFGLPSSTYTDVYGNHQFIGPGGTDTLGRVMLTKVDNPNQTIYYVYDSTGAQQAYTVNYQNLSISTAFNIRSIYPNAGNVQEYTGTRQVISSIVLPNNVSYRFQYDSYGMITEIDFPTGAVATYTWANDSVLRIRYVTSKTLTVNGQSSTWTFAHAAGTAAECSPYNSCTKFTVTDPQQNQSVYCEVWLGKTYKASIYKGAATGTPLRQYIVNFWANDDGAIVLPISITTQLENGLLSKKEFSYDSGATFDYTQCGADTWQCAQNPTVYIQNVGLQTPRGNVLTIKEYDWGQGAAGPLIRTTTNKYLHEPGDNPSTAAQYAAQNIVNKIIRQTIADGAGITKADTQYEYDNAATSGPFFGSVTKVKRWRNTDGAWLATTFGYDTFGNITSATDPLQHQTTWSYDDNWASGNNCLPSANSHAYVAQRTDALGHRVKFTRYACTGQVQAHQDENDLQAGRVGTNYTYDLMNRPLVTSFSDGGQTSLGYPNSTTVEELKKISTTLKDDSFVYSDGLGRPIQSKHLTPTGNVFTDTGYDVIGRVGSVSNPYISTSDTTYGITQTQYDALGRVTQVTKQDGSVSTVSYNGNCTTTTDEAGKQRRSCTDGLGRLIEVDEPGDNFSGAAASGQITVNGTLASSTSAGTPGATASATFSILDNAGTGGDTHIDDPNEPCPEFPQTCPQLWDRGSVQVTVNGTAYVVSYGQSSTDSSLASSLASAINGNGSVTASANGINITVTARTAGAAGNSISFAVSSSTSDVADFGGPSFFGSTSGGTLSGGVNAVAPVTTFDKGTVSLTIGSFVASTSYGPAPDHNTAAAIVSGLLDPANPNRINRTGSPVSAQGSGSTLSLTYTTVGTPGNVGVSAGSSSTQGFAANSFTGAGSLAGGANPGPGTLSNPYITQYQYDALGNLLCVEQHGDATGTGCASTPSSDATSAWRVRRFTYDSLSRLLTAYNPESGTISYVYDNNGNLLQKTSPAPNQTGTATQTISFCYDALNRVTGKAYGVASCPLSSPVVGYIYDQGTNGVGKLTSLTDQAGSGSYVYDVLGRITSETRTINGVTKNLSYGYNLDGSIATVTYPSGAVITYTPDSAGRVLSAIDNTNNINYATAATYGADGALIGFISGKSSSFNGITNSFSFNQRLQPLNISAASPSATVFSLNYDFHSGNGDNGNVYGITNNKDTTRNQAFTYDALNRLTSAQNAGTDCTQHTVNSTTKFWGNNYSYDAWGNLLGKSVTKCSAENLTLTALANNQLSGYGYDAAGNMTHDLTSSNNYAYDQENRITGAAGFTYAYDEAGNRVKKSNGSTGTLYWCLTPGIVAESDLCGNLQSEYVFFDGERVARKDFPSGSVSYYFSDELKTASIITAAAGNIKSESDYYPWGGELQVSNGDSNHYKFTGKERDSESGLDLMGLRYYGSALGRFTSPDPEFASPDRIADPQQWNMYVYARNNPLSITDPTGLDFHLTCSGGNPATCHNGIQGQTTTDANGNSTFTAFDVDINDPGDPSAGYHDQFGNQYTGSFDENSGVSFTNTATGAKSSNSRFIDGSDETDVNGSGAFNGIQGRFNSNCGGSCAAKGSLYNLPGHDGAVANLEKKIGKSLEDNLNFFGGHGKADNYRFGADQLTHIVNHLDGPDIHKQEVHFEGHAPGRDVANFVLHQVDAIRDKAKNQSAEEPRLP
jgi:RHS repeat-associated protein